MLLRLMYDITENVAETVKATVSPAKNTSETIIGLPLILYYYIYLDKCFRNLFDNVFSIKVGKIHISKKVSAETIV